MWKASNFQNYPLNIEKLQPAVNGRVTRGVSHEKLVEPPTLNKFIGNATRLWNKVGVRMKSRIMAKDVIVAFFMK